MPTTKIHFPTYFTAIFLSIMFARTVTTLAYPELTRHGYASCIACHVSPNGGGSLTPYGRNLSRDMLSTWGGKREAEVLHGLLSAKTAAELEESNLRFGGDIRSIQTHRNTSTARSGQYFLMQANAELGWDAGRWATVLSIGKVEDPRGKGEFRLNSQRFFGLARFGENANLRAGRFSTAFGLNLADHTLSIRRPLGLGPEVERDNVEFSWLGEKNQSFVSFMNTVPGTVESDREQAAIFRYERILNERSRLGGSFWHGDGGNSDRNNRFTRAVVALHSIINLSDQWFLSGEFDRQERTDKRANGDLLTQSQYAYLRLQYEPAQGVLPLIQYQHERGDFGIDSTETNKYGFGINFFPRPHFEFLGVWNRSHRLGQWSDEANLLFHYYL